MAERHHNITRAALVLLLAACGGGDGDGEVIDDATAMATTVATTTGMSSSTSPAASTTTDDTTGDTTGEPTTGTTGDAGAGGSTGDGEGSTGGAPVEGSFIAVGDGGVRARSVDGVMWTTQVGSGLPDIDGEMAPPDTLRALAVGDGFVVAVGGGGSAVTGTMMVMRSEDGGESWQEDLLAGVDLGDPQRLYGVAQADGVLVAAGQRGKRIRSEDGGLSWAEAPSAEKTAHWLAVAAGGGAFVVAGWSQLVFDGPVTSALARSTDAGATWSPIDESFARIDDLAYGAGHFIAVGATQCLRSPDGATWTECSLAAPAYQGVDFVRGEFVAITSEGLVTSADGAVWSEPIVPPLGPPTELAFGAGRYAGIRWIERGRAEQLDAWSFTAYAEQPLRALVFVPAR